MNFYPVLRTLGANHEMATGLADPFYASMALNGMVTDDHYSNCLLAATLLGQCAVETGGYRALVENLNYRTPAVLARTFSRVRALPEAERAKYLGNPEGLANLVYSGRFGNGDAASGDGWRYRGRGCLQTTFYDNYLRAEQITGHPYTQQPELLEIPSEAALSAVAYFAQVEVAALVYAESQRVHGARSVSVALSDSITRRVNPAMLEAHARSQASTKALQALLDA